MDGKPRAPRAWFLATVLSLLTGLGVGAWVTGRSPRACAQASAQTAPAFPVAPQASASPRTVPSGAPVSFADLAEQVAPSVTNIVVSKTVKGMSFRVPSPFRVSFATIPWRAPSCLARTEGAHRVRKREHFASRSP